MADTASTSVSPFNFGTHAVRVVMQDGTVWFVAADVCAALGYKNTSDAVATHLDDDEKMTIANSYSQKSDDEKGSSTVRTPGGARLMTIINESGLYALVLRSRKPEARKFAKWVTSEVLPAIRKTGSYELPNLYKQQPGDKLSAEQQQALRQLLEENVKRLPHAAQAGAMVKGWSKLKSHFGVSYRDIPAERYTEAVSLLTRHISEVMEIAPAADLSDKERLLLAMQMANRISSEVTMTVMNAVMNGDENWRSDRWMFGITHKPGNLNEPIVTWASQIPGDACVMSLAGMAKAIAEPGGLMPSDMDLISIAGACTTRLANRIASKQQRAVAA